MGARIQRSSLGCWALMRGIAFFEPDMKIVPSHTRRARTRGRARARTAGLALALAASLACPAAPAQADVGTTIIERCAQGKSISGYTQQDYRRALQELPTEVEEYSDCANLIRRAQLAAAGGGAGSGSGEAVTPLPLTPTERASLARVPRTGAAPLQVGGGVVRPGVVHASVASALSSLPTPLLAMLAFLLACALALAARSIRDRVLARRAR